MLVWVLKAPVGRDTGKLEGPEGHLPKIPRRFSLDSRHCHEAGLHMSVRNRGVGNIMKESVTRPLRCVFPSSFVHN